MAIVKASMAGTVWKILVTEGEQVEAGQDVVILESMKMAIPIESSEKGEVSEIRVAVGDFVNEGDVLMVLKQQWDFNGKKEGEYVFHTVVTSGIAAKKTKT